MSANEEDAMEWENSFDEPDRVLPPTIPVSTLKDLVNENVRNEEQTKNSLSTSRPALNSGTAQLIVVPDTNIWINSRGLLDELLTTNFEKVGLPFILIPWMVLQELDDLMKGPRKGVVQISIQRIESLLASKHPRVRGQKPSEVALAQNKFPGSNEDDSILQCAMQCCETTPNAQVVFLTDDRNLRNKAMVIDIPNLTISSSTTAFKDIERNYAICRGVVRKAALLKAAEKHVSSRGCKERKNGSPRVSSQTEPKARHAHHDVNESNKNKRKLATIGRPKREPSSVDSTSKPKVTARSPSPQQSKAAARCRPPSPKKLRRTHSSEPISSEHSTKSQLNSFPEITKNLQETLAYLIEFQMKVDCGEENWRNSLKIKPPWTLRSALKCIDLHWIAIFSYVFGSRGRGPLDRLAKCVQNYQNLLKLEHSDEQIVLQRSIVETALSLFNCGNLTKLSSNAMTQPQVQACRQALMVYLESNG